jgi:hypothetical protein
MFSRVFACVAAAASVSGLGGLREAKADTKVERRRQAEQLVAEALCREIYGSARDRAALLQLAESADPAYAPAFWHQGHVRNEGHWLKVEDAPHVYSQDRRWDAYRHVRREQPNTLEGHLAVAAWCRARNLPAQERAHLNRVLEFDTSHSAARDRLGYQRIGNEWVSPQDVEDAARQQEAIRRSLAEWGPPLREIVKDLAGRSERARAAALARLNKIESPEAAPALERVLSPTTEENSHLAINVLSKIVELESTRSLARHAVMAPWESVRKAAAEHLQSRPLEDYVPALLGEMYTPLATHRQIAPGPGGRLLYRHAFVRQGQTQHELMVLDTAYTRVEALGGDRRETLSRAMFDLWMSSTGREMQAAQQNAVQAELNQRIGAALQIATRANVLANSPEEWWKWWNEHNEVYFPQDKPLAIARVEQEIRVADRVDPAVLSGGGNGGDQPDAAESDEGAQTESGQSGPTDSPRRVARVTQRGGETDPRYARASSLLPFRTMPFDCLVAGTPVWTIAGPTPVEQLQPGDMVLSQHPETGELAYQPVLRTTVRPRGKVIRIIAEGETIAASGGHLFWVAGEGWVKARHLEAGQELHGCDGPVGVSGVEPGDETETYNLEVADFNSYFVGATKILCHDNTIRRPTTTIVPGLAP